MKNNVLILVFAFCSILLIPACSLSEEANQAVWADFTPLTHSDSNDVVTVKESVTQHLFDSFKGMQYKRASLILDDQSWVQRQTNEVMRFSGRLDFNTGIVFEQQYETTSPFPKIQGGPVIIRFPTPRGGISRGELFGVLYVEDVNGSKRKFSIGAEQAMRIVFGRKPDSQSFDARNNTTSTLTTSSHAAKVSDVATYTVNCRNEE